ncbi:MAG: T9SS type A sorting domain-containing protein [Bacteroidetes bacterium]|nr:T9SS type A sorting domain-containing protein [Bacteroidota bacterium]
MKNKNFPLLYLCLVLVFWLSPNVGFSQTLILEESFETDGNGDRYNSSFEFFDGKDDYFGRIYSPTEEYGAQGSGNLIDVIGNGSASTQNGDITGQNGDFYIGGEDQDDDGGDGIDEKDITFELDISNASGLTFKGLFAAGNINPCGSNNYDDSDYLSVFYSIDGSPEVQALCFNADLECNGSGDITNEPLHLDPDCNGDGGEGGMLTNEFSEFSFSIPDGNMLTLRIESHMDAGNEEIAYDWVRVEAQTVTDPCMAEAGTLTGMGQTICAGETIDVSLTDNQTDAAYSQVFLIATLDFNITSIQTGTNLTFTTPGIYNVYSYNYETAGTSPSNPAIITEIDCSTNCCDLQIGAFTVMVLPNVTGTFTAPSDLCLDALILTGQGGGTPFGGVYSGPGVTDDGNGLTYSFDPSNAGVGIQTITYTPAGQCESAASDDVEVFALPTVGFTGPGTVQLSTGVQSGLSGGTPSGGLYSGPGVTDNGDGTYDFDPAAAGGVGTYTITYSYVDANGCAGMDSDEVVVEMMPLPGNECDDAQDINPLFGQEVGVPQVSGIWDNTNYTSAATDPADGWECFAEPDGLGGSPSLERTIWYSFTGDGNTYKITTIPCDATNYIGDGDTQMAIYSGDCAAPTPVACNEDDPSASDFRAAVELETTIGTEYLLMIDGFGPDFEQMGEYCVEATNLTTSGIVETGLELFRLSPNPTTGRVQFEGEAPQQVRVFDSLGRLILDQDDGQSFVDISSYPSGVYSFLLSKDGDSWQAIQVVKK